MSHPDYVLKWFNRPIRNSLNSSCWSPASPLFSKLDIIVLTITYVSWFLKASMLIKSASANLIGAESGTTTSSPSWSILAIASSKPICQNPTAAAVARPAKKIPVLTYLTLSPVFPSRPPSKTDATFWEWSSLMNWVLIWRWPEQTLLLKMGNQLILSCANESTSPSLFKRSEPLAPKTMNDCI